MIPSDVVPNLRDNGKTLAREGPRLLQNLQKGRGYAFTTEGAFRGMVFHDTGYLPGVSTFPKWLDREAAEGNLHRMWLQKGGVMPTDGSECKVGVLLIRWATSDKERAEFRRMYKANVAEHGSYRVERTNGAWHRDVYNKMRGRKPCVVVRPPPAAPPRRPSLTLAELEAAIAAMPREAPS